MNASADVIHDLYTNQATSLARDIAVRSVIGLHKSEHVSDVICSSVLYIIRATTNEIVHIEVTLLYKYNLCIYKLYITQDNISLLMP